MALPANLQKTCNDLLEDVSIQLDTIQKQYFEEYGCYWQGLSTHSSLPEDGDTVTPRLDQKPGDPNAKTWGEMELNLPNKLPLCLSVHAYGGPQGQGYVLLGVLRYGGKTYSKAIVYGPEKFRAHEWFEYFTE